MQAVRPTLYISGAAHRRCDATNPLHEPLVAVYEVRKPHQLPCPLASVQLLPINVGLDGTGMPRTCRISVARGSLVLVTSWQQWVTSPTLQLLLLTLIPFTRTAEESRITKRCRMKQIRAWRRNAMEGGFKPRTISFIPFYFLVLEDDPITNCLLTQHSLL